MHFRVVLQLRDGAKSHRHHAIPLLNQRQTLDPDIRQFVEVMSAAWARHGNIAALPPVEARRIAEEVRAPWTRGGPRMAATTERIVPTPHGPVRVRCYDPGPAGEKPILIYIHGGGWTFFSVNTHDRVMREYAARAGVIVAGVDYALSPEAKYPVALEQIVAVARFLGEGGQRILIGGDSAGANLALAVCLRLRDEGQPDLICAVILNYGVFDREPSPEAHRLFGGAGNVLTSAEMEGFWHNYLRDERDADDPLVCPLRADLHGLPPALLVVPQFDLLTEQSVRLAGGLTAAGVDVKLEMYRGAVHSFLEAVSIAAVADRAFDDTAAWLRAHQ
ncbi:MAG: alpha/beta hydrolase [Thermoanaerobaculia bacterium]